MPPALQSDDLTESLGVTNVHITMLYNSFSFLEVHIIKYIVT